MVEMTASRTARARVREELTLLIKDAARRQLADGGSAALSLRAVARDVGMVSSAVYRYFPSRDELLTALIIDAYDAVGEACELAESVVQRNDYAGRWRETTRAARNWALEHPHEYSLIFGSPVPGYQAPTDTVDPAARIPLLMLRVLADAVAAGRVGVVSGSAMPPVVGADMRALSELLGLSVPEGRMVRAVMAWTQMIGSISFEMFGHLKGTVADYPVYFDYQMAQIGLELGF